MKRILVLIGYALMCSLSLLLVIYLRFNRREALKGDPHASRKVILPAFEPLLWILAGIAGIYVIFFSVALQFELYTTGFPDLDREFFYCGRMFVFILVLVFLRQKSVSLPALRCTIMKTLILSSYTLPMVWIFTRLVPLKLTLLFFVKLITRPLLLVFVVYTCMVNPPAGRANHQVLRRHGWFIVIYHILLAVYSVIQQYTQSSIVYPMLAYTILVWSSVCPLMIWRLLAADTEYWRGMGKRVCSLQQAVPPCSQFQVESAVNEDISSHGLHELIEMHRKFLIDFAHLEIKCKTGSGGVNMTMFSGLLRSQAVAIKVYTPVHFTEEVVGEFSHEAALCASLSHPNIVQFFGMCVCPPTVCLVTELCQFTLEDLLGTRRKTPTKSRQSLLLNVAYMLDCSRALAYIHSFSPSLLHRDIKPANLHLDQDNTLKLTDFSHSRRLPSEIPNTTGMTTNPKFQPKMTVTGTIDYMAPEMIKSSTGLAAYAEPADVYSLSITFWDLLYPDREKYPTAGKNHHLVFEGVLRGLRPSIERHDDTEEAIPDRLLELITFAWRNDPKTRPTAHQLVVELEKIQEEILAPLAQDLLNDFSSENLERADKTFTGDRTVVRLEQINMFESKGQAVRLGRALMDAGFLHHSEHCCGFLDSDTSLYYLDEDNISFCQPLAILEEVTDSSQNSDASPAQNSPPVPSSSKTNLRKRSWLLSHLTSTFSVNGQTTSTRGSQAGPCGCRLHGQLQEIPQTPSSGRFRRYRRRKTLTRSSNSLCSDGSISVLAPTPKKWHFRRRTESEDPLRNELLDDEQQFVIDIFGTLQKDQDGAKHAGQDNARHVIYNAVDAHAKTIKLSVDVMKASFTVVDDGDGIHPDNLYKYVGEHYATSKLPPGGSKQQQKPYGSRGAFLYELVSLATAVEVESRVQEHWPSYRKVFRDGKVVFNARSRDLRETPGTKIAVANLFSKLPVRSKDLSCNFKHRTRVTRKIHDFCVSMSMIWPSLSFDIRFQNEARPVIIPSAKSCHERFLAHFGPLLGNELQVFYFAFVLEYVSYSSEFTQFSIRGYFASIPSGSEGLGQGIKQAKSYYQFTFLENEWVDKCHQVCSRVITDAALELSSSTILRLMAIFAAGIPIFVLKVEIPSGQLDAPGIGRKECLLFKSPHQFQQFLYEFVQKLAPAEASKAEVTY
ncbi:Serine/threonine-protein kinase STY8 [Phytophthora citrophthora]|uniref:Serine/threonine-protein kinase STY8 n=1 Tax=Phytophthora citrophthora TaxID=4793 RepID=A0AAD9G661_9STRA|nr:Serine/threonine-protein kinase STY8 [Phytophthora citrophthora]